MRTTENALDLTAGSRAELFLTRALEGLSPNRAETLFSDLMTAASRQMDRIVFETAAENVRSEALGDVARQASLGLEYAAEGDPLQGTRLLAESPMSKLVNTGAALLDRLKRRARTVEENLILKSELPILIAVVDELNLANTLETVFLAEMQKGRIAVSEATPRIVDAERPKRVSSLDDIRLCAEMTRYFDARATLFRAFPANRLFAHAYPTDERGDTARVVLSRALVRVALSDGSELRFDVDAEDAEAFVALDANETNARLTEWAERLIDAALPSAERSYGRAYINSCIETLLDALPTLV